ncbi:MAG TPA: hypothetical protein VM165_01785, partial [Planctomycetaceae bacterium]|nr:hypothetical protein [Planctomycetaceae bacterium]
MLAALGKHVFESHREEDKRARTAYRYACGFAVFSFIVMLVELCGLIAQVALPRFSPVDLYRV